MKYSSVNSDSIFLQQKYMRIRFIIHYVPPRFILRKTCYFQSLLIRETSLSGHYRAENIDSNTIKLSLKMEIFVDALDRCIIGEMNISTDHFDKFDSWLKYKTDSFKSCLPVVSVMIAGLLFSRVTLRRHLIRKLKVDCRCMEPPRAKRHFILFMFP